MANVLEGTPYSELLDAALSKLRDYDLAGLSQEECYAILAEHIRPACVKFRACIQNLKNRDDLLQQFNFLLSDYEIEILSNEIVRSYINATYINTPLVLKTMLSSRDFNTFSNANHLNSLMALNDRLRRENEQLISGYSWENSTLYNGGGRA